MSTLKVSNADVLVKTPLPQIGFHIGKDVLPVGGIMCIAGEPGCGKSYITMDMCISLVQGNGIGLFHNPFPASLYAPKPCTILYLDKEMGQYTLQRRFNDFMRPEVDDPFWEYIRQRFHYVTCDAHLSLLSGVGLITEAIQTVGADICVLDPLRMFHNAEENDSGKMSEVFSALDAIIQLTNCSLIIDHHFNKPSNDPNDKRALINRLRGSTVAGAAIDCGIAVHQNTDTEYQLKFFKTRHCRMRSDSIILDRHSKGHCEVPTCKATSEVHPLAFFQERVPNNVVADPAK